MEILSGATEELDGVRGCCRNDDNTRPITKIALVFLSHMTRSAIVLKPETEPAIEDGRLCGFEDWIKVNLGDKCGKGSPFKRGKG